LEAKIALELFAQRLPGLRLVTDQQIAYAPMLSFRGLRQLLVMWAPTNGPQGTEDT